MREGKLTGKMSSQVGIGAPEEINSHLGKIENKQTNAK